MFIFWSAGFYLDFRLACHSHKYVFWSLRVKTYELMHLVVFIGDIAIF